MRISQLPATAGLAVLAAWVPAAATEHAFGEFVVNVRPDAGAAGVPTDYQITVENAELMLTRLTASYRGTLSNSFVADLDKDGGFEVVVTYTHADGVRTEIDVYSWDEYLLQPLPMADLDDVQRRGYRGGDEFAVRDGQLVRMFQVYEQVDGEWLATAARRQLRYSFDDGKWAEWLPAPPM